MTELNQSSLRAFLITHIRQETDNVKTYFLKPEDGKHIDYKSGQFLSFVMQHGREELRRSYSIISSPALNEQLAISVKRVENGIFSRELFDHKQLNATLQAITPAGLFVLPENIAEYKQVFFLQPVLALRRCSLLLKLFYTQTPL